MSSWGWSLSASRARHSATESSRRASRCSPSRYAERRSVTEPEDFRSRPDAATLGHLVSCELGGGTDSLDLQLELVDIRRPTQGLLERDQALLIQAEDRLLEALHPVLESAGRDRSVDLTGPIFVDDAVANERGGDHDFDGRHASEPVRSGHEALRDRRLQHARELDAYLSLLMRRKDRDDPIDRLRGIERMESGEDEVTGFSGVERRFDGLVVAHLADEDDVGILTEGTPQGLGERGRIDRDLALVHDGLIVPMEILDRILDRHDVRRARRVDVIDHRGERRALAAAGRAGDEDQPAFLLCDL